MNDINWNPTLIELKKTYFGEMSDKVAANVAADSRVKQDKVREVVEAIMLPPDEFEKMFWREVGMFERAGEMPEEPCSITKAKGIVIQKFQDKVVWLQRKYAREILGVVDSGNWTV